MPFRALGLDDRILQAVQEAGYTEPTPIQAAAIPAVLAGQDLIGIAQTGTGKTAAFTLPLLTMLDQRAAADPPRAGRIRCLILAPTRELVAQIHDNVRGYARHLPTRTATVFGGVGEEPQKRALRAGLDILIATPGRLLDLVGQGYGDFTGLDFLVLDEADRMLDMGFIPDVRRIVRLLPADRQTLLFSASLSREIEQVTREFLDHPKLVQIGRRANPAETVTQFIYEVGSGSKLDLLIRLLADPAMDTVLIFTRTKHGAKKIAAKLDQAGIRTGELHSNRSQAQRLRALKDFKSGTVRVLVATDIASRGIDVDGISHVINFDFPRHPEDYVHRIGRTGRAQAVGDAISFVTPEDTGFLRALERFIGRGIVRKQAGQLPGVPEAAGGARSQTAPGGRTDRGGEARHGDSRARPSQGQSERGHRPQRTEDRPQGHRAAVVGSAPRPGGPQRRRWFQSKRQG